MPMVKQKSSQKHSLICRHETGAHEEPNDQEIATNDDVQKSRRATLEVLAFEFLSLHAVAPQEIHAATRTGAHTLTFISKGLQVQVISVSTSPMTHHPAAAALHLQKRPASALLPWRSLAFLNSMYLFVGYVNSRSGTIEVLL